MSSPSSLADLGLDSILTRHIIDMVQSHAEGTYQNPYLAILCELGPEGDRFKHGDEPRILLKKDLWKILIVVAKRCDVVEDPERFSRLAELAMMLYKGDEKIRGHTGIKNIKDGEPELWDWFKKNLKPDGPLDSAESIRRVAFFIAHLGQHGLLPNYCDELFMPCASLITLDMPRHHTSINSPNILSDTQIADIQADYDTWYAQVRIAALCMHIWAKRYASDEWASRHRVEREERLPWPLHATYPDPDGKKWPAWMAWKAGFRKAHERLVWDRQTELAGKVADVMEFMEMLEDMAGEEVERQRDHAEAEAEGAEIVVLE